MKEKFNSVKEKLKTVWGGLAKAAKILIISALIVIIVGSVGLTVFLNKKSSSDWIVLFRLRRNPPRFTWSFRTEALIRK